jgi:hypothetical protein
MRMTDDYFDERTVNGRRLFWAIATRRQLERWEPIVAADLRDSFAGRERSSERIWTGAIEHHFVLIAAHHLLAALDLPPASGVSVDPTLRAELTEGRHLHEHWPDNMPVFNRRGRNRELLTDPPRASGRSFAVRNPKRGPYWWLGWSNEKGAQLLPNVPAPAVHELLDAVEAEVLASDPALSGFVPPRAPSPWLHEEGEWWPKADNA